MKRVVAYFLNNIILLLPTAYIFILLYPRLLMILNMNFDSNHMFFVIMRLVLYVLFLPFGFIAILIEEGGMSQTISMVIEVVLAIICLVIVDTLLCYICRGDIGKRICGLKIISSNGNRASIKQLFIRCLVKYAALGLCPFLMIYPMFNSYKLTLHDKISKMRVQYSITIDNML